MGNEAGKANGSGVSNTSLSFPVSHGFIPINGSTTQDTISLSSSNASAKVKVGIRRSALDTGLDVTDVQPTEWHHLSITANLSRPPKRRCTTTQETGTYYSKDISTGLKHVKSASPHTFFDSDSANPSVALKSCFSPKTPTQTSEHDGHTLLSSTTINSLPSSISNKPGNAGFNTGDSIGPPRESIYGRTSSSRTDSFVSEGRPDATIADDSDLQSIRIKSGTLGVSFPNHSAENHVSHLLCLPTDENLLFNGWSSSDVIAANLNAEDFSVFPEFCPNVNAEGTRPQPFPTSIADHHVSSKDEVTVNNPAAKPGLPESAQGLQISKDDLDKEDWNPLSLSAPVMVENGLSTIGTNGPIPQSSTFGSGMDEFEGDLTDEDWNAVYEEGELTLESGRLDYAVARSPSEPSYLRDEKNGYGDDLCDEDMNYIYDLHTSAKDIAAFAAFLPSAHLGETMSDEDISEHPAVTPSGNESTNPMEIKPGISTENIAHEHDEFDEEIDEDVMLQAEADVLTSGVPVAESSSVDNTLLLQAEEILAVAETFLVRKTTLKEFHISPLNTPLTVETRKMAFKSALSKSRLSNSKDKRAYGPPEDVQSTPFSINTISSRPPTSPIIPRKSKSTSAIASNMSPFLRSPFPPPIIKHSVIYGISNKRMLRVCFRLGEVFRAIASQRKSDTLILVEFYAAVIHSIRFGDLQRFEFADLFFPNRPPFLQGFYEGWKGTQSDDYGSHRFLDTAPAHMRMCRAVGILIKTAAGPLSVKIQNVWEASWDDVRWVRGIVSPEACNGIAFAGLQFNASRP